ncbi:hypothetical protein pipiens_004805 [Culex pipiens pipiens]|uniref:C2H2-type domain-containing protein n=1 Tax=Culex pipiens pipiens TaxID=38569 RepID=A0ABD1CEU2_CULPP
MQRHDRRHHPEAIPVRRGLPAPTGAAMSEELAGRARSTRHPPTRPTCTAAVNTEPPKQVYQAASWFFPTYLIGKTRQRPGREFAEEGDGTPRPRRLNTTKRHFAELAGNWSTKTEMRFTELQTKVVPIFPLGTHNHNQKLIQQVYQWTGVQISYQEDFTCAICWKCTLTLEEFQRFCDRCRKSDWVIKQKRSEGNGRKDHPPAGQQQQQQQTNHENNAPNQMDDRRFGYPLYPLMQPALGYEFRLTNVDPRDRSHAATDPTRAMVRSHNEATAGHVTKTESRIDIDTEFKHVLPVERLPEELVNMLDLPATSSKRQHHSSNGTTNSATIASNDGSTPPKVRSTHCVECGAKFSERRDYQKHQERFHGPNATASVSEIFHCEFCSRVFTRQRDLTKHLRLFHEPPEDIKICQCQSAKKKEKFCFPIRIASLFTLHVGPSISGTGYFDRRSVPLVSYVHQLTKVKQDG